MHDGSMATLSEVLDFYATAGHPHPSKSPFMKGFVLTPEEKDDVLNFLRSLTDEKFVQDARFSDPWRTK
jgi:cytochrome c peroxidase